MKSVRKSLIIISLIIIAMFNGCSIKPYVPHYEVQISSNTPKVNYSVYIDEAQQEQINSDKYYQALFNALRQVTTQNSENKIRVTAIPFPAKPQLGWGITRFKYFVSDLKGNILYRTIVTTKYDIGMFPGVDGIYKALDIVTRNNIKEFINRFTNYFSQHPNLINKDSSEEKVKPKKQNYYGR